MSQKGFIMELLAPAGTMENFMAALESGADAIYLGGKVFNARAHAANFGIDELREAVRLAHILDVSVYVTVNILIGDTELKDLEQYIKDLDSIGVDAIIVQDLAVAEIAKRVAPNIHLHGSTQMTAATLDAVRFYESLGFTRVVLARELSLKEIQHICKHCKAEIEVFVHGALCVCYSGQCLMSSFIGGRSGNRGACAQPCRLPYELLDSKGESVLPKHEAYLLSPKDLNYSEHMNELVAAGVTSFKVEGRMKKVSYVRQVIGTYREILDEASIHENQRKALASGFNRGFSTAYLEDTVGRQMMTVVAPNHQGKPIGESYTKKGEVYLSLTEPIEQGSLVKILQSNGSVTYYTVDDEWTCVSDTLYKGRPAEGLAVGQLYLASTPKNTKSRGLQEFTRKYDMSVYLSVGSDGETNYTELTAILDSGLSVTVTNEYVPAIANKVPTSLEKVTEQLGRLGNTLFRLSYVDIPDGPYMWPASVLNALRRDAVTALETALITHHVESWQALQVIGDVDYDFKAQHELSYDTCPMISARVDEIEGVKAAISSGAQKIVFGGDRLSRTPYALSIYDEVARLCAQSDVICTFATPRVVKDDEVEAYTHTLEAIVPLMNDNIDTDQLIPKQFLKAVDKKGFGKNLMFEWRYLNDNYDENPDFVFNKDEYRDATILVTGDNFGSGSSREHAAWALEDYGFRCVIAGSFSDIHYNNELKNGMLPIVQPLEVRQKLAALPAGEEITIDLPNQVIKSSAGEFPFEIDHEWKRKLVEGLDDIGITLQYEDLISAYEKQRPAYWQ